MLAVRVPSQHAGLRHVLLMFVLPMAGVSITGLALGYWWLHRYVLGPLDHLSRLARDPSLIDGDGARRSLDRTDQIGGVARALQFLHSDLATWRERVQELENQMDRRIQARTSEMSKALKRIARQVAIDPLTGLYNRRFLDERFDELFDEHRRVGQDLSVVMIDVDNFKLLNDQCGHAAGDDVLRFVAKLLEDSTRATDFAVRYGGDEFCIILTATNAASAEQLAARVVAMFGQNAKMLPVSQKPSLSAGVASIRVHCPDSATQLLQMADAALYACKKNGKSLVRQYESTMQTILASIV
jgi:diguanylate cyclase (GGDEF)-like protein